MLILPCCIGDVVMATATLKALRRGYPQARITWAVGGWSRRAIEYHDLLDAILDTGDAANPARTPGGLFGFVRQLRAGQFDLAVSLVRSPLMSLAVWLSGIPYRAGLDSGGRGFGYNIRAAVDPNAARHEAEIYLDVPRALGLDPSDCYVNVPVRPEDEAYIKALLAGKGITGAYVVIHPAGGSNPGMVMDSKRWLPANYAALIRALKQQRGYEVIMLAGTADKAIVDAVQLHLDEPVVVFLGELTFGQITALAKHAAAYIGNDTGLTHLAAAAGAKTVMILGPSDPKRYAPYTPDSLVLWKPTALRSGGVASGSPSDWDWTRDGVSVEEVIEKTLAFLKP